MVVSNVSSENLKMRLKNATARGPLGTALAKGIKGKMKSNRRINARPPAFDTFSVNKLLRR